MALPTVLNVSPYNTDKGCTEKMTCNTVHSQCLTQTKNWNNKKSIINKQELKFPIDIPNNN